MSRKEIMFLIDCRVALFEKVPFEQRLEKNKTLILFIAWGRLFQEDKEPVKMTQGDNMLGECKVPEEG